ncbi:uncharacterized [Tachysurus ichikawai]
METNGKLTDIQRGDFCPNINLDDYCKAKHFSLHSFPPRPLANTSSYKAFRRGKSSELRDARTLSLNITAIYCFRRHTRASAASVDLLKCFSERLKTRTLGTGFTPNAIKITRTFSYNEYTAHQSPQWNPKY